MAKQTKKTATFTSLIEADKYRTKLEGKAKCPSAKRRVVYRVVVLNATKRPKYLVCATPWAFRLQQQGRGSVVPMGAAA